MTQGKGYEMNNSIPAPIRVIDTNGDGFADRMYAADMGGRIWRFDIFNGKDPTSTTDPLVAGGIFATLGAGDVAGAQIRRRTRAASITHPTFRSSRFAARSRSSTSRSARVIAAIPG